MLYNYSEVSLNKSYFTILQDVLFEVVNIFNSTLGKHINEKKDKPLGASGSWYVLPQTKHVYTMWNKVDSFIYHLFELHLTNTSRESKNNHFD